MSIASYNGISPLTLTAAKGLLENTGLGINSTLVTNITNYKNIGVVREGLAAIAAGESNLQVEIENPEAPGVFIVVSEGISTDTLNNIKTFTAGTVPALNNTIPTGSTIGSSTNRFTDQLTTHAYNILGNGDLSKFVIHMSSVQAYQYSSGEFINSATNIESTMNATFTNMDNLITGNISGVSLATNSFGIDLYNTGRLINFSRLDTYGTPEMLILPLVELGLIKYISAELIEQGVSPNGLISKVNGLDQYKHLPTIVQMKCYEAFKNVTGDKLTNIKNALLINNSYISTLADLVDTKKIFPTCFQTLTSPVKSGYKAIYINASGAVNSIFEEYGISYYSMIPDDIADANIAMRRSLQQVKNIQNMNARSLGTTIQSLQTNYGLDLINALDKPLDDSVKSYFTSTFGTGSGTNGSLYLSDGIGTPAGIVHNDALPIIISTLNELTELGSLDGLYKEGYRTGAFTVIIDFLNDYYGTPSEYDPEEGTPATYAIIPGGYPGAGTYDNYDDGVAAILADASATVTSISSSYPTQITAINTNYNNMNSQVERELAVLASSNVDFATTPSSPASLLGLARNLRTYAYQNEYRGPAELLEKMANTSSLGGQAIVGTLREGRNIRALQTTGIGVDNSASTTVTNQEATLSSSTYTISEALSNISL